MTPSQTRERLAINRPIQGAAGKTGTIVLFFVLSFGMLGFITKTILEKLWRM